MTLYQTLNNIIENVGAKYADREGLDEKIFSILQTIYDNEKQHIETYFIHYDDDSGDYDRVADAVMDMARNRNVLDYTVIRYSDYDIGVVACVISNDKNTKGL